MIFWMIETLASKIRKYVFWSFDMHQLTLKGTTLFLLSDFGSTTSYNLTFILSKKNSNVVLSPAFLEQTHL